MRPEIKKAVDRLLEDLHNIEMSHYELLKVVRYLNAVAIIAEVELGQQEYVQ